MRNYAGHRLAPWLAHVMVSRQETARALLTPGEVMQLSSDDELLLVAGLAPVRARKLRYYADSNFARRVGPPPCLAPDTYADRPAPRTHDWETAVRQPDARLIATEEMAFADDGGLEQQRHPGLPEKALSAPDAPDPEQSALADDEDPAVDQRAMDQARSLSAVARGYGLNESASDHDLVPGL
jgi:type IV secretion system protein VirD4